jgi:hypothetical protein
MGRAAGVNTVVNEALMAPQEIFPGKSVPTAAGKRLFIGICQKKGKSLVDRMSA